MFSTLAEYQDNLQFIGKFFTHFDELIRFVY